MYDGVGLVFECLVLPKKAFEKIHTQQRRKRTNITTKHANLPKSGLTMTVNTGRLSQAINNLLKYGATSDHDGHEYVSTIVVSALQEEQLTPKVLHANQTRLTKLTVYPRRCGNNSSRTTTTTDSDDNGNDEAVAIVVHIQYPPLSC